MIRVRWWLADRLRPNVWPSTAAQHEELLATIREIGAEAELASMQAEFWRARAIELGADEKEWRRSSGGRPDSSVTRQCRKKSRNADRSPPGRG
jgi:hypothetical protein